MSMRYALGILGLALLALTGILSAAVPELQGRVNDYAGLLSQEERARLESKLEAYERETSCQLVLLTVESLEGDSAEEYANAVFRKWKIGQAGKDNGILVLFSLGDRKLRIEVGYGLEGAVPDSVASSILRDEIAVHTKRNDFYQGFDAGFDALIGAANGEYAVQKSGNKAAGKILLLLAAVLGLFVISLLEAPWWIMFSATVGLLLGLLWNLGWPVSMVMAAGTTVASLFLRGLLSLGGSGGFGRGRPMRSSGGSTGNVMGGSSFPSNTGNGPSGFSGGGGDSGGGGASGDG